jgi:hypothetical protein
LGGRSPKAGDRSNPQEIAQLRRMAKMLLCADGALLPEVVNVLDLQLNDARCGKRLHEAAKRTKHRRLLFRREGRSMRSIERRNGQFCSL